MARGGTQEGALQTQGQAGGECTSTRKGKEFLGGAKGDVGRPPKLSDRLLFSPRAYLSGVEELDERIDAARLADRVLVRDRVRREVGQCARRLLSRQ